MWHHSVEECTSNRELVASYTAGGRVSMQMSSFSISLFFLPNSLSTVAINMYCSAGGNQLSISVWAERGQFTLTVTLYRRKKEGTVSRASGVRVRHRSIETLRFTWHCQLLRVPCLSVFCLHRPPGTVESKGEDDGEGQSAGDAAQGTLPSRRGHFKRPNYLALLRAFFFFPLMNSDKQLEGALCRQINFHSGAISSAEAALNLPASLFSISMSCPFAEWTLGPLTLSPLTAFGICNCFCCCCCCYFSRCYPRNAAINRCHLQCNLQWAN